jgi:hypothetical protein
LGKRESRIISRTEVTNIKLLDLITFTNNPEARQIQSTLTRTGTSPPKYQVTNSVPKKGDIPPRLKEALAEERKYPKHAPTRTMRPPTGIKNAKARDIAIAGVYRKQQFDF